MTEEQQATIDIFTDALSIGTPYACIAVFLTILDCYEAPPDNPPDWVKALLGAPVEVYLHEERFAALIALVRKMKENDERDTTTPE